KKDKIRNLDIVGALCSLKQFTADNIGIIDIQQNYTTVTLLNIDQSKIVNLQGIKIKGKNRKVELKSK
ncbi:MAG: DbpA RNA binding domain-containing protein, partial [Longicatena sp.]